MRCQETNESLFTADALDKLQDVIYLLLSGKNKAKANVYGGVYETTFDVFDGIGWERITVECGEKCRDQMICLLRSYFYQTEVKIYDERRTGLYKKG